MTTGNAATHANSKMRPEHLLMHHDLRFCCMCLTDMRSLQGRPEAQGRPGSGFRKLAPQKITEAVVFIKNAYETACKET